MTTQEVAYRLIELSRHGQIMQAQEELYGNDIVSIEPSHAPVPVAKGKQAVNEKGMQFASSILEHHGMSISEPIVVGNRFSIGWTMDVTMKDMGRVNFDEICVYEVKDGKIVNEQFFY